MAGIAEYDALVKTVMGDQKKPYSNSRAVDRRLRKISEVSDLSSKIEKIDGHDLRLLDRIP
ncbi:hypothetical protein Gbth_075_013 [Gluconobacter thailandicus F149-1 = NBRC 100600]|jgi:hypothetical protein|uniref:Uncharacterized protein n=2 Tax=Acetobacter aceti TaxID=435 RepID=A0A6S6PNX4_ACEAC|nr:hypothetical protein AAJCM20276_36370 [Acetobacter aceti]BCK77743.1 hypothetical protein EMQ_P156 [Acetobacter aceti NBRC 14818]GAN94600.1 hypothetical protein Gbth_075_013 [Gluconobacter thailandicus F149-1 = NBRC 100600]GBO81848.1 FAD synthase [Acetobacter aceti NRIC 0242]GBR61412.1 hypothetical protein AA100600_2765 [Gluconobacter thailandicus F149-1 = NBRC 100600]